MRIQAHSRTQHRLFRPRLVEMEGRATPAVFMVTSIADLDFGSLRQAVLDANSSPGADSIEFDTVLFAEPRTIVLANGEIAISDPLTVTGPGADKLAISGGNISRIFRINPDVSAVVISGLTFTAGHTPNNSANGGSAVYSNSQLKLQSCIFRANSIVYGGSSSGGSAVAVESFTASQLGNLELSDCQFLDNVGTGGAVTVRNLSGATVPRSVVVDRTLFLRNSSYSGGAGLHIEGKITATISNSTFSGNRTGISGGRGGGISIGYTGHTNATVRNCTIVGNTAGNSGGGIFVDFTNQYPYTNTLTIQNSTIAGNTAGISAGGIHNWGALTILSSIVSGNKLNGGAFDLQSNKAVSIGQSAIGASSGFTRTDLGGNLPYGADLKLGRLCLAGGSLPVMLPAPSSPLVNAGSNPAVLPYDQRGAGFPRQVGSATDIGAAESDGATPVAIPGLLADVTASGASTYSISVTYCALPGLNTATVGTGDLQVSGPNGFIETPTFKSFTSNAQGITATYALTPPGGAWAGADVGEYAVTINPGAVTDQAGTPVTAGDLARFKVRVPRTLVVANDADGGPGSLRAALDDADRIAPSLDTITFDKSYFSTPRTILLSGGALEVEDSIVIQGPGADLLTIRGGIGTRAFSFLDKFDSRACSATLSHVTLVGDPTNGHGGGLDFGGNVLSVFRTVFRNNQAIFGGAINVYPATTVDITDSQFSGNVAIGWGTSDGGAIRVDGAASATIRRCQFEGNQANRGGALSLRSPATIDANTISNNTAGHGGGIYFAANFTDQLNVFNTTISANQSVYEGGGIAILHGVVVILNSTITANTSFSEGGGFAWINENIGSLGIESSIFSGNVAFSAPDILSPGTVTAKFSALGSSEGYTLTDQGGNLSIGIDLKLAPLANYGGAMPTHALLAGSPALNAGSNPVNLLTDQRGYLRVSGPTIDIGAYEAQPPRMTSVVINNGDVQRSRVTSVTVKFDSLVTFNGGAASAFRVTRQDNGSQIGLIASATDFNTTSVTLTFNGALTEFGSLRDGRHTLRVRAANAGNFAGLFDGNGDGTGGDDYVLVGNPATNKLFRLYGDADGNGTVDAGDFAQFGAAFGASGPSPFDFNIDLTVDALDFAQFGNRFGLTI